MTMEKNYKISPTVLPISKNYLTIISSIKSILLHNMTKKCLIKFTKIKFSQFESKKPQITFLLQIQKHFWQIQNEIVLLNASFLLQRQQ